MAPSPDAPVRYGGSGGVFKIREGLTQEGVASVVPLEELVVNDIFVVEIHASVQDTVVVKALNHSGFVLDQNSVLFGFVQNRIGMLGNVGIVLLCADIYASVGGVICRCIICKALRIFQSFIQQETAEHFNGLLLNI